MFTDESEQFMIKIGLSRELVEQLKRFSLDRDDEAIQKNTSDLIRFGKEGAYEEWYTKQRTPFALVDKTGGLAALVWFGPKPIGRKSLRHLSEEELKEEYKQGQREWHTLVYRSYAPYRGKGLMTPFVQFAITTYRNFYPNVKIWAGISLDNQPSIALARKLGFSEDEEYTDLEANWTAMILK